MGNCKECYHYEVCRMHYQQKCELTYETEKEVRRAMREAEKGTLYRAQPVEGHSVHFHYDEIGTKAFWTELEASEHIN